jgi:hypothetical protein
MNYKDLLEHSYAVETRWASCETRLEFLANSIFGFTTYDGGMDELFARKAVEVCEALLKRKTMEYIKVNENYVWYLMMCNLPFFSKRIEWGTSIRGAWWQLDIRQPAEFESCGFWVGDKQLGHPLKFTNDEWDRFIAALIEFAAPEMLNPSS